MKILITGFDPFNGESINPAYEAVKRLPDHLDGHQIIKKQVPTVFKKSIDELKKAMDEYQPDIIICVGQAGGRAEITIERIAINIDDARIKDNEGKQPIDMPIVKNGPAAYFSNLPIKHMLEWMKVQKIPANISDSAGTFVCNHIMYGLMHDIMTHHPERLGGFIHVPFIPEQVMDKSGVASMNLDLITKGLLVAVQSIVSKK